MFNLARIKSAVDFLLPPRSYYLWIAFFYFRSECYFESGGLLVDSVPVDATSFDDSSFSARAGDDTDCYLIILPNS